MLLFYFIELKTATNKVFLFLSFLISQIFYNPVVFSNPYLENTSDLTCELDQDCLRYLKNDLDKQDNDSIYKVCEYDYKSIETCCKSLNNCPSNYGVERDLSSLKSNLLNSEGTQACSASSMANLMSSVDKTQNEVCQLGAKNCKGFCEDRLNHFERRIKSCFSINSSINEALKQARKAGSNSSCYSKLKEVADKYKRQSRTGKSELRDNLSSQDIVNCEGIKNKGNTAVATKKIMGMCQEANQELLARKQAEEQKKAEEERIAKEEELKKAEQERQAEIDRQRAEELKADQAQMEKEIREYTNEQAKQAEQREKEFEKLKLFARENHGEEYDEEEGKFVKIKKSEEETKSEKEDSLKKETEKEDKTNKEDKTDKPDEDKKEDEEKADSKEEEKEDKADKPKPDKETKEDQDKSKKTDTNPKAKDKPAKTKNQDSKIKPVASKVSTQKVRTQQASPPTRPITKRKNRKKKTVAKKKQSKNSKLAKADKTKASNTKLSQTSNTAQSSNTVQTSSSSKASISSLAGNTDNTSQCPPMPEISSQVVYQSVEAPQIEPLSQETDPYNNYDLVANKPAVVLLSIKPPKNLNEDKEYKISLKVNNKITKTKCSSRFNTIKFSSQKTNTFSNTERKCRIKDRHFRDIIEKVKTENQYQNKSKEPDIYNLNIFVELPTKYAGDKRTITKDMSVVITSNKDNQSCSSNTVDFSATIRKTRALHLDFISLNYDHLQGKLCKHIEVSNKNIINDFANSEEVNKYLPMMYPIGENQITTGVVTKDIIYGSCNTKDHLNVVLTEGILSDFIQAKDIAHSNYIKYLDSIIYPSPFGRPPLYHAGSFFVFNRKLVVIVSEEYMKYHNIPDTNGFIIRPTLKNKEFIGGWNVAFVSEEAFEDKKAYQNQKSQGIVLHEIAHLLGQKKDYYKLEKKIGKNQYQTLSPDKQSKCKKFLSDPEIFCYNYRIFGGLIASFKNKKWKFVNDKFPFMSNEKRNLDSLGIDRETYQKLFQTLHDINLDPTKSRQQAQLKKTTPVISLAGIYDKKKGRFYNSFSVVYKKGIPSLSYKKGAIEVSLYRKVKTNNSIKHQKIAKANAITDMELKILLKNGGGKRIKLEHVPIIVNLPIPQKYLESEKLRKELRLIVRENFYTLSPVKKKNPYIHNISFGGNSQTASKKRRILYNAPIDWSGKPEDFLRRKRK